MGSGAFKSTNSGKTWLNLGISLLELPLYQMAIDPKSPNIILASGTIGRNILRSEDGGKNWTISNQGFREESIAKLEAAAHGETERILAKSRLDFAKLFATEDGGNIWSVLMRSSSSNYIPQNFIINAVSIHPKNPNLIVALSVEAEKIAVSIDAGRSWQFSSAFSESMIALDPNDENTIYLSSGKSTDHGKTWQNFSLGRDVSPTCMQVDPQNSSNVFALAKSKIYQSSNGGISWKQISIIDSRNVITIKIDPQNSRIMYAAGEGGVFKSENGGKSWFLKSAGLSNYTMTFLSIDPFDTRRLFTGGHGPELFISSDGGTNWSTVNLSRIGIREVNDCLIDPGDPAYIYRNRSWSLFHNKVTL